MFEIKIDVSGPIRMLEQAEKRMREANNAAIHSVAEMTLGAVRQSLSFAGRVAPIGTLGTRTGRLVRQTQVKYFQQHDGLMGASIKVRGDRAHIMIMNEYGTKTHGKVPGVTTIRDRAGRTLAILYKGRDGIRNVTRGFRRGRGVRFGRSALPARHVLLFTWNQIESAVSQLYRAEFERAFNSNT